MLWLEVMGGRRPVSTSDDGLKVLDCLSDRDAGDMDALGSFGTKQHLWGEITSEPDTSEGPSKGGATS